MSMTKSGSASVYYVYLFKFIELYCCVFFCVVWFCLLVCCSQVIGWEDYTLLIIFVSKGFPCKDQIEELFIVMVYCLYSQHVALSTFSLISLV